MLSRKYYYSNYQSNKKIELINQNKKIKIGYVSADFGNHPVSILLARVIELHDKSKFEIYAYSLEREEDEITIRLKNAFDKFTNCVFVIALLSVLSLLYSKPNM